MRVLSRFRLMPALVLFLVAFAPAVAAQDPDPDEEVPILPPVDESTPEEVVVPVTCDPLGLILCVGPVQEDTPVVVSVFSDGVVLAVWLHEDESESVGPVQENVTVPVTGTEVPVTLCPNTCPVPVPPEIDVVGSLIVCITVGGDTECVDPIPDLPSEPCDSDALVSVCDVGESRGLLGLGIQIRVGTLVVTV